MDTTTLHLLLADDDTDDCIFFKDALEELTVSATLTTVNDGAELMDYLLKHANNLPDVLYLDLNMPCKSGFQCMEEIKLNEKLNQLPVIIFSTSFDKTVVNQLHQQGALYYMRKPGEFSKLKEVLQKSIDLISKKDIKQPPKENFVLNSI